MFLVLFQTILNIVDMVNGLLETFGNFSREIQEMSYLHSFFALKNIPERKGCIDRPVRRIRFEHVCFSYPNAGTETLHDINFELDLSKSTAIVGENGSGKTTIIKLLCGLYQPTSGRILFDEYDIRNLNNGEIGKAIKVVFQDFFQYELTIRENIGFGNLARISHDLELQEVLDAVHLEELKKLGLNTSLGKLEHEGIDLSRGQWQRLAVGRIFLNDTGYAVLDEPTASVDPVSEYNMYQLFYLLLRSRGSLMISHRLASAKMADHILVLKNGTIAEQGNHTELMKNQELAAFTSFQTAAKYFLVSLGRIPECAAFVKDYYDFMDMEEAEKGTEKLCSDFDSIKVKQLSFSYPGRKTPAVSNLSFTIKRNEVVAIVGNNGSGKTTLVKLLTGLYQAQKGQIYYGRQNLRSLDPEEFYKQISFVSQDFIKYELTVRENIGIGDWKQIENTDKIYMLLHQVGLETFTSQASVNQLLGDEFGGRELSVGQWQKLAIARGMMKDSSVIFLDEPTAALDPLMETKVLKMFLKIAREKTAIIVSHRIGICKEVDKIIVMKEGKIAEIGNHEELLAEKGEYYRLYTMQQKWYEE